MPEWAQSTSTVSKHHKNSCFVLDQRIWCRATTPDCDLSLMGTVRGGSDWPICKHRDNLLQEGAGRSPGRGCYVTGLVDSCLKRDASFRILCRTIVGSFAGFHRHLATPATLGSAVLSAAEQRVYSIPCATTGTSLPRWSQSEVEIDCE